MGTHLLDDVREFLRGLESTQEELSTLYGTKRKALVAGRSDDLLRIAQVETSLTGKLQSLLEHRGQILEKAKQSGIDADSILALVGDVGGDDSGDLQPRIVRARHRADELRRETWIHWIIAHRSYSHYSELLELIAHCGAKSPTYGGRFSTDSSGGAIFDASV